MLTWIIGSKFVVRVLGLEDLRFLFDRFSSLCTMYILWIVKKKELIDGLQSRDDCVGGGCYVVSVI